MTLIRLTIYRWWVRELLRRFIVNTPWMRTQRELPFETASVQGGSLCKALLREPISYTGDTAFALLAVNTNIPSCTQGDKEFNQLNMLARECAIER